MRYRSGFHWREFSLAGCPRFADTVGTTLSIGGNPSAVKKICPSCLCCDCTGLAAGGISHLATKTNSPRANRLDTGQRHRDPVQTRQTGELQAASGVHHRARRKTHSNLACKTWQRQNNRTSCPSTGPRTGQLPDLPAGAPCCRRQSCSPGAINGPYPITGIGKPLRFLLKGCEALLIRTLGLEIASVRSWVLMTAETRFSSNK